MIFSSTFASPPRKQVSLHSMFTSCHREHLHTPFGNPNFESVTESCAFYCYCFFCFPLTHWSSSVMLFFSWIELSFDTQPLQYKSHTNTTTTVHSYCCCCWSTLKLDNHFSFFLGLANPGYPKLQLVVVVALFLSSFLRNLRKLSKIGAESGCGVICRCSPYHSLISH